MNHPDVLYRIESDLGSYSKIEWSADGRKTFTIDSDALRSTQQMATGDLVNLFLTATPHRQRVEIGLSDTCRYAIERRKCRDAVQPFSPSTPNPSTTMEP